MWNTAIKVYVAFKITQKLLMVDLMAMCVIFHVVYKFQVHFC